MNLSINKKVNLGFGLTLALLLAISAISYRTMIGLVETVHWEVHTHEVLHQIDEFFVQLQNAETGQRGYIITGEERYLEPYRTALSKVDEEFEKLRQLSADNPRQQRRLDRVEPLLAEKLAELEQTIMLYEDQGFDAALRLIGTDRGKQLMDSIRSLLREIEEEEQALLYQRERDAASGTRRAIVFISLLNALNFGCVLLAVFLINRDINRRALADQTIRKAYDELDIRVKERTAELAKINQELQLRIEQEQRAEAKLKKSHDDMLSILNQLRLGTVKIDKDGAIVFLSRVAQQLLGKRSEEVVGASWEQVFPFQSQDKQQLKAEIEKSPPVRGKVPVYLETAEGRHYWMDIDVRDDPRDAQSRILFLYDVTEVYDLRRLVNGKIEFQDLIGKSKPMRLVYQRIREVAEVDSTVLIEGETGTGKELVARAIHFSSHRRHQSFVPVNCAGLTESLLGSQLFGHKRGAFTGAIKNHRGLFEEADGGTILLDELGDISLTLQTSLLRVLQEKEITPLGESRPRKIDVRVIAATQCDLTEEVDKGNFRADLLYRIRVARIQLPPLRERREDIPLLVAWFLEQARVATGKPAPSVSDEAMRALLKYEWPGNVRELRSAVEFAVIRHHDVIQVDDLPPEITGSIDRAGNNDRFSDDKQRILSALQQAGNNRTVAARLLGISRATLYRRLAHYRIDPDADSPDGHDR